MMHEMTLPSRIMSAARIVLFRERVCKHVLTVEQDLTINNFRREKLAKQARMISEKKIMYTPVNLT